MYRFSLFSLLFFLSACSTVNQVNQIIGTNSLVNQKVGKDGVQRFRNIYPEPVYPYTCESDCYAPQGNIQCTEPMENCQFTGQQRIPNVNAGFSIRWLGHASFMITSPSGEVVLFDPVFEQFDWPVDWGFQLKMGYSRKAPAPLHSKELASVDAVMYSHIHYDHFNKGDIAYLGTEPEYLVPLGFAEHFAKDGYRITEMAWYDSKRVKGLNIDFVPGHHFSSRIWVPYFYEDRDKTLWGGWLLEQNGKKLFFAGDTGYSDHFKDIHQRYGDIDICLIPIASYFNPESSSWYRYVHTTPEDALAAADDLNCKVMIPWGYGNASWKMGDKTSHSALFRLLNVKQQLNSQVPVYILNEGESVTP